MVTLVKVSSLSDSHEETFLYDVNFIFEDIDCNITFVNEHQIVQKTCFVISLILINSRQVVVKNNI